MQNIVAHVENPVDHIKIIAAVPSNRSAYVILDTVNQLAVNQKQSPYLVWAILNSTLINWYAYRFIFGKAIRTMHFDNSITARIPVPKTIKKEEISAFDNLAKKILDMQIRFHSIEENSNEWEHLESEIEKTDKKIDEEVYKLYNLTPEEIKIVEGSNVK